ncbi:hypothetical protein [Chryseobacterium sp.]|uniref:hypothetical protein n=1 Tax=Chryseobacterium sp. TaxID=1871047 RepID=UPI00289816B4|nr:hypothetical protein [Chryseobacterium sp.]
MFYKSFLLSLGILSLFNCQSQKIKTDVTTEKADIHKKKSDEIIYFKEGENKFLKDYQMNITFKGISEDSRCPKDVQCIWSGVAVAQIEVMGTATRPMILQISSIDNPDRNYHKTVNFNGYDISLADVMPYPESSNKKNALKSNYSIGIIIKKAGENITTK